MRGRTSAAAALAALAASLLPAAAAAAPPPNFWGVDSIHEPPAREFKLMADAGVEVYRAPIVWREVEPDPPVESLGQTFRSYDWSIPDRYFRRAGAYGVALQITLIGTPAWIDSDAATSPVRSDEGRRGWRDFVAAVVARYGRDGAFWAQNPSLAIAPPITYQIWNEQNTSARYKPAADPAEYADLFRLAGRQIRALEPGATIVPGGMFGTPQTPRSDTAWRFMKRLLREPGVRLYLDAAAIHPYSPNLRGIRFQFRKMRKALRKSGMRSTPIYVTEVGWSSGRGDSFFFLQGRKGQARLTKKSLRLMLKKRKRWKLERVVWFSWRDLPQEEATAGCALCAKFGLLKQDLTPKPSFHAYTKFSLR